MPLSHFFRARVDMLRAKNEGQKKKAKNNNYYSTRRSGSQEPEPQPQSSVVERVSPLHWRLLTGGGTPSSITRLNGKDGGSLAVNGLTSKGRGPGTNLSTRCDASAIANRDFERSLRAKEGAVFVPVTGAVSNGDLNTSTSSSTGLGALTRSMADSTIVGYLVAGLCGAGTRPDTHKACRAFATSNISNTAIGQNNSSRGNCVAAVIIV